MEEIFSKPLSSSDVSKDLALPTRIMPHLPFQSEDEQRVDLPATDVSTGILWEFQCFRQLGNSPKPVLRSKGWKAFVQSKKLEVGDNVTFYKSVDEAPGGTSRFWVAVEKKKVMVFGVNFRES